jgi:hypothetical protein
MCDHSGDKCLCRIDDVRKLYRSVPFRDGVKLGRDWRSLGDALEQ